MIELFTAATPNGHKASIALEEMALPYTVRPIELGKNEQKEPWFLALNPNGRIPVIVDHDVKTGDGQPFAVFESGAILLYLAEKTGRFLPVDPVGRSTVVQWLMFQMAGVGPMMGQLNVFARYAPEKIPFAIERYQRESRRLLEVLDRRLATSAYLAGSEYGIADIANFAWARSHGWSGALSVDGLDHLHRWLAAIEARPAVARGLAVPKKDDAVSTEKQIETARNILA